MQDQAADKAGTLFLSYARADAAIAQRLANTLEQLGYTVWWDALIAGGEAYSRSIADALDKADAVLVLWSAHSVDSDWVKDEAAQGREAHRLVPLSVDGTQPPLGFRQYQVIDVSRWRGRRNAPEIAAAQRAIQSILQTGYVPPRPPALRSSRRAVLIGGTAAGAALVAGGGWLAWDRGLLGAGGAPLSIAVLPFRNLGGDQAQTYFADGLTEEVRGALTRIPALQVLAGTSSEKASGQGGAEDDRRQPRRRLSPVRIGAAERRRRPHRHRPHRWPHRLFALVRQRRPQAHRHFRGAERHRAHGRAGDVGPGRHRRAGARRDPECRGLRKLS